MDDQTLYIFETWQISIILLIGIFVSSYIGYRIGMKTRQNGEQQSGGLLIAKSGMITLLSLMLGFTFGMSSARYKDYKKVMMDEVNCISTALLQADLYPEPYRTDLRTHFRKYIVARIDFFNAGTDFTKISESKKISGESANNLWKLSTDLFKNNDFVNASRIMAPSLNKMFDVAATREANLNSKVPSLIPMMIFVIILIVSYNGGTLMTQFRKRELFSILSFAVIMLLVINIILDLDRPDSGLVRPTVEQNEMIKLLDNYK